MSAFNHTSWTVICNGETGGRPCGASLNSDELDRMDPTTADVRKRLKSQGWLVGVKATNGYPRRLDYCPDHKPPPSVPAPGEESGNG